MKKNWIIAERKTDNIIQQLMINRGLSADSFANFLNPDFSESLHDAKLLPDFEIFLQRIIKAKKDNENVGIFADYDADGVPGAAFLHKALTKIGIKVHTYIPSRSEGYGLNEHGIDQLVSSGCTLIITVDLGIKNFEEALYCKSLGIDLIISDHHTPDDISPDALAVINPKLNNSKYPFKDLCGAGVAYKLVCGLMSEFSEIDEAFIKWNLDLIAISTVSDVVPLLGENRVIAKYGISVLKKTKNIGLEYLLKQAQVDPKVLSAYHLGYVIGPRINAPGRIAEADKSFKLLITSNRDEAEMFAYSLDEENSQRQDMMKDLLSGAEGLIQAGKLFRNNIIIVSGNWAKGIIGPSASKIADKYSRPVIVFTTEGEDMTGSARSACDIDIFDLISQCKDSLKRFGGHKGAAGLSVEKKDFKKFTAQILKIASESITPKMLERKFLVDKQIDFRDATFRLVEQMEELEPFGMGNKKPLFMTRLAKLRDPKFVGRDLAHLSSFIEHKNSKIKSIYFNCPDKKSVIKDSLEIDILYNLSQDIWNGKKYLSLNVVDIDIIPV